MHGRLDTNPDLSFELQIRCVVKADQSFQSPPRGLPFSPESLQYVDGAII